MLTVSFDLSSSVDRTAIREVLDALDVVGGRASADPLTQAGPSNDEAARFWAALRPRIGDAAKRMCMVAVELGSFGSFAALADALHEPEKRVRSWHRNLGRSERRANDDVGSDMHVIRWDFGKNEYRVPAALAHAISATEARVP